MPFFVVKGNGPVVDSIVNGEIHLNLNETGVVSTGNSATFTNNINELTVDKYGRIQSITTGSADPIATELFQLHGNSGIVNVNGREHINILGKNNQIKTVLTDNNNNLMLQLTDTNINNQNAYTYELRVNNAQIEYYDMNTQTWLNNITLIKGKYYIFRQSDVNFPIGPGAQHAIDLRIVNGAAYTTNVEFYINSNGPLTNTQYNAQFTSRVANSTPYVKFYIPTTETNNIEFYSQLSPGLVNSLPIAYNTDLELTRYNNINSISIDNTGRVYDVEGIIDGQGQNMVSFNLLDNTNNSNTITNKHNLQIKGKTGHLKTNNLNSNTLEIELEQTNVLNANNEILEIRILNSKVNVYDSINLLQNEANLLKGITYTFDQSNMTYQNGNALSLTTNPLSIVEYSTGVTYHYTNTSNNEVQVSKTDYVNSFVNNLITNRKVKFTPNQSAPPFLYLYSNNNSLITKLRLIIREDTQLFSNIKNLTIDKYGRIVSILSDIAITNNNIVFELTIGGYVVSTFGPNQQTQYKTTLSFVLGVSVGNINIKTLTNGNGAIHVNTEITQLADTSATNIKNIIDVINNDSTIRNNFISQFNSNGLSNINSLNLNSQSVISVSSSGDDFSNISFKGNSGDTIPLLEQQTLNIIGNPESIDIVGNNTLKNLSVNLKETGVISTSALTQTFNQNINELTVDKYGRIHNVVTGNSGSASLPPSGVAAGTYGPSITQLVVNQQGLVTSVTSGDFQTLINNETTRATNAETNLTNLINTETTRATTVEGLLPNLNTTNKTSLVNAINDVKLAIDTEASRANGIEVDLRADLNNEITLSANNNTALTNNLNNEISRAVLVEGFLTNLNTTTKSNLVAAVNENKLSISNEQTRATTAEGTLTNLNTTDKTSLVNAVNEVIVSVTAEQTRATAAESTLTTNLNNEITRATGVENGLDTRVDNIETNFASGVVWQAAYPNISGLDALVENNVTNGWVYYIESENRAYVIVGNTNGHYRPTGWTNTGGTAKSFLRIADYTDLSQLVSTEQTRATNAENTLTTNLNNEITRATNVENTLTTNLTNETNRAIAAEATLTTNLNNEITRATAAENANTTAINNEVARATGVEGALNSLNTTVKTSLVNAINENVLNLSNEITRATGVENTLTTNLNNEITRATNAENANSTLINNEVARATGVEGTLTNLNTTNKNNLVVAINDIVTLISNEVTRATNAENTLTTNLSNETTRATGVEGVLSGLNTSNKTNLVTAINEILSSVSNEITRATNAESTLTTNLNNEITRATNAENGLDTRVNTIESNLTTGAEWKGSYSTISGTGALNENVVQKGWIYYISDVNKAYVVVDNANGDYRPVTWTNTGASAKSFIQMANFSDLAQLVTTEQTRATNAENAITANLNNEINRAIGVEGVLNSLNTSNKANLVTAINEIVLNLSNEVTRATSAENTLTTNLTNEINRAIAADGVLTNLNTTNKTSLVNAINEVLASVSSEQTRATTAEGILTTNLNNEITRATAAENANNTAINNEVTRATASENTLTTNLNNEITRATGIESTLTTNLNNEITRATGAETANTTAINNEVSRATGAENTLTTNLNNEITRATGVEGTLSNLNTTDKASLVNAVNENFASISSETTRATNAENAINANLNKIGALTNYSAGNTLLSHLGNLNNIPGTPTNVLDYLKSVGDISNYSDTNTVLSKLGNISGVTIPVSESLARLGDLSSYASNNTALSNIYTKSEVDTAIANLVDSAPTTLNTLNELAAALNDDPNFATTITTSIGNKQDTITGAVSDLTTNNLTAGRAVVSNGSGKIVVSAVTDTQIGYLSNVTSDIQSQIANAGVNITGAASSIISTDLTSNKVVVSDNSGKIAASSISDSDLKLLPKKIGIASDVILFNSSNIISTYDSGSGFAIVFNNNGYLEQRIQSTWGAFYSSYSISDFTAPWTIMLKTEINLSTQGTMDFGFHANTSSYSQGGNTGQDSASPNYIRIHTNNGTMSGLITSGTFPTSFYSSTSFIKFVYKSNNKIQMTVYDVNYSQLFTAETSSTITFDSNASNRIPFIVNRHNPGTNPYIFHGLAGQQGETLTPQEFNKMILLRDITTILANDLTLERPLVLNNSGKIITSNTTNTELDYLSGVSSKLQDQLDTRINVNASLFTFNSDNVVTSDAGDTNLPTYTNNQLISSRYDGWAPKQAPLGNLNLSNPWRIIVKYQFPSVGDKYMNINLNGNTVGQNVTPYLILYDGSPVAVSGMTINDNSSVPSSFYTDGNPHFIVITRRTGPNETDIQIYNNAYSVIWDTTVTTDLSYTNTYPVGFYCNDQYFNVLGMMSEQSNTITPQILDKQISLQNIKNVNLNDLDINKPLTINGSGQLTTTSVTNTELGYLSGTTSNVQTQLNTKLGIIQPLSITFNPNIIEETYAGDRTDGQFNNPVVGLIYNNNTITQSQLSSWGLKYSAYNNVNFNSTWRIIYKLEWLFNGQGVYLDINFNQTAWNGPNTTDYGTSGNTHGLRISGTSLQLNGYALTNTSTFPTTFTNVNGNSVFLMITRKSSGIVEFHFYDNNKTQIYNTESTTPIAFSADLPVAFGSTWASYIWRKIIYVNDDTSINISDIDTLWDNTTTIDYKNLTLERPLILNNSAEIISSNVTNTELDYLSGVTSSIQTQLTGKQNVVANVSDTEIGYLDGVTSAIQTQLTGKQNVVANVSDTEIGYLDGVTSSIQTQLNNNLSLTTDLQPIASSNIYTNDRSGFTIDDNANTVSMTVIKSAWGFKTENFVVNNLDGEWRLIIKINATGTSGITVFDINLNSNTALWYNPPAIGQDAGSPSIRFRLSNSTNVEVTPFTSQTGNYSTLFSGETYMQITRQNDNKLNLNLFDSNFVSLWSATSTNTISFSAVNATVIPMMFMITDASLTGTFVMGPAILASNNTITPNLVTKTLTLKNMKTLELNNLEADRPLTINSGGELAVTSVTNTELGYLSGVTSNIQTQLTGKQNVVANVSDTEIGYLNGVTSNIQAQLDAAGTTITGAATTVVSSNLTADKIMVSNNLGKIAVSDVSSTVLENLNNAINLQSDELPINTSTVLANTQSITVNATSVTMAGYTSSWGFKNSSFVVDNLNGTWRLIIKFDMTGVTLGSPEFDINFNSNTTTWAGQNASAQDVGSPRIRFRKDGSGVTIYTGSTITNTGGVPNPFWNGVTYMQISRQSNNKVDYTIFDNNFSSIWQSTTNGDITFTTGNNDVIPVVFVTTGMNQPITLGPAILASNNTITPNLVDKTFLLSNMKTIDVNNVELDRPLTINSGGELAMTSVTNTELGYLSGVSGKLQDQLDTRINVNASLFTFNSDNVTTTTQVGDLPSYTNNQLIATTYDAWAPKQAPLGNLTLSNPWRIIVKYQFPSVGDKYMNINIDSNSVGQNRPPYHLILNDNTNIVASGLTVNDNSQVPSSFYTDGNPHFIVITRRTGPNETDVQIYNNAYSVIWDTTITTDIPYTNTYPIGFYCNNQLYNVLGMMSEQGNTITPQILDNQISLQNIKTVNLNDLDINKPLTINGSGQLATTSVTNTELGYLSGVTSGIQTQLTGKQNVVANVSDTEIGYLDGVTSSIQTQLGGKQATITGTLSNLLVSDLPTSRAIVTTPSGKIDVSAVTSAEIGYLDGVTSNIQTQLTGKQNVVAGVSDTEIGYLSNVTSDIQTQINNASSAANTIGVVNLLVELIDDNILKTYNSPGSYPTLNVLNGTILQDRYSAWGIKKSVFNARNIDPTQPWQIIIKTDTYTGSEEYVQLNFNVNTASYGTTQYGQSVGTFGVTFQTGTSTPYGSGVSLTNTSGATSAFWTSASYILVKKLSNNKIQVILYNSDGTTVLLDTTLNGSETYNTYNQLLPMSLYLNNNTTTHLGYLLSKDNITPIDFERYISLKTTTLTQYLNTQVNNVINYGVLVDSVNYASRTGVWSDDTTTITNATNLNFGNVTQVLNNTGGHNNTATETIVYDFPAGYVGGTAYINHSAWSDGGYVECYVKSGSNYVYTTKISTYNDNIGAHNFNFNGARVDCIASGYTDYNQIEIRCKKGRIRIYGLAFTKEIDRSVQSIQLIHQDNVIDLNTTLTGKQNVVANVSDTEIGYLDGVTSAIQTQLDSKGSAISVGNNKVLITDGSGNVIAAPNVDNTELDYLNGVTSNIQTQLTAKQNVVANVSDTEIGYLDGVTSAIQTQLDEKLKKETNLISINTSTTLNSNNTTITSSTAVVGSSSGWGFRDSAFVVNDLNGVWRLIIKVDSTSLTGSVNNFDIVFNSNSSGWHGLNANPTDHGGGGISYFRLNKSAATTYSVGGAVSNLTNTPAVFWTGITYLQITKQSDNKLNVAIYDTSFTNLWNTTSGGTITMDTGGTTDNPIAIAFGGTSSFGATTMTMGPAMLASNDTMLPNSIENEEFVSKLNELTTITATTTELNYLSGVTSNIQTQLGGKQATITGTLSNLLVSDLPTSRAIVTTPSGKIDVSAVTSAEIGYLDGVTSNIQTQLTGKQNNISVGNNKVLITDGSGNVIAAPNVDNTELDHLNGVTGNIQTQFTGKQDNISVGNNKVLITDGSGNVIAAPNVDNTELDHLNGVTGNIQTQLNNISAGSSPFKVDNLLPITPKNIAITFQYNMSDDKLPIIDNQEVNLYDHGKAWGVYSTATGLNLSQSWRIIFKQQFTKTIATNQPIELMFGHNETDSQWLPLEPSGGGVFSTRRVQLRQDTSIATPGLTVTNTSAVPSSYYSSTNPTYTEITRISDGKTDVRLYDDTYTLLYYTQITTIISYTSNSGDMPISSYHNVSTAKILGVLYEQGESITPSDLNQMLTMNVYAEKQISIARPKYSTSAILSAIPKSDIQIAGSKRVVTKDILNIFPTTGQNTFTLEFWIKFISGAGANPIPIYILKANSAYFNNPTHGSAAADGLIILTMTGGGILKVNGTITSVNFEPNTWEHIVIQGTYGNTAVDLFNGGTRYQLTVANAPVYAYAYKMGLNPVSSIVQYSNIRIFNKFIYNPNGTANPNFAKTSVPNVAEKSSHRLIAFYQSISDGTDDGEDDTTMNVDILLGDSNDISNIDIDYNAFG